MGFTGKEADEEVGLVYFGQRYLIPRIARWSTPDPLQIHALGGGEPFNSYHYVSGNLLQATDPIGLGDPTPGQQAAGVPADADVQALDPVDPSVATYAATTGPGFIISESRHARQERRREHSDRVHNRDQQVVDQYQHDLDVAGTATEGTAAIGTALINAISVAGTVVEGGVFVAAATVDGGFVGGEASRAAGEAIAPDDPNVASAMSTVGGILGAMGGAAVAPPDPGFMPELPPEPAPELPPPVDPSTPTAGRAGEAGAGGAASGLDDLARFRSELGLAQGEGTLARLDVGGRNFYGINAHGQPVNLRVNAITRTHAEADAFQQAANAGVSGGRGTLYVDRALCPACGQNGGVRGMMRQLGLEELEVITPQGTQVIRP